MDSFATRCAKALSPATRARLVTFFALGSSICLQYLPLVNLDRQRLPHEVVIGLLIGTMFGWSMMSACWCALRPGALYIRLLVSLATVPLMPAAFGHCLQIRPAELHERMPPLAFSLFVLWDLAIVVFLYLRLYHGWLLTFEKSLPILFRPQFSLRLLLVLMASFGIAIQVLSILDVSQAEVLFHAGDNGLLLFVLLASIFIPKDVLIPVSFALFLLASWTTVEVFLLHQSTFDSFERALHLDFVRLSATFWVLLIGGIWRSAGCRLARALT